MLVFPFCLVHELLIIHAFVVMYSVLLYCLPYNFRLPREVTLPSLCHAVSPFADLCPTPLQTPYCPLRIILLQRIQPEPLQLFDQSEKELEHDKEFSGLKVRN